MDFDLSPRKVDFKLADGEGGSYYSWSTSKFPFLSEAKVGAGWLLLRPRGFALPHYADSTKIGYVLQGSCTVGRVSPGAPEQKVWTIKEGNAILCPSGKPLWLFNGGDSDCVIVFIGDTSKAYVPGEFTYFLVAGTLNSLSGFSADFIRRFYGLSEEEATELVTSQKEALIVKLDEGKLIPQCNEESSADLIFDLGNELKNGVVSPWIGKLGLSARVERLEAGGVSSPEYAADSAIRVTYVAKGGGRVQIVGLNGKRVLDAVVEAGDLFVVPKLFMVAKIAGEKGMECFSVITSSKPLFGELNGNASVYAALSPEVLEASLGVTPEFGQLFRSKITK